MELEAIAKQLDACAQHVKRMREELTDHHADRWVSLQDVVAWLQTCEKNLADAKLTVTACDRNERDMRKRSSVLAETVADQGVPHAS